LPRLRFIIGCVNFRKAKVSKAAWLVPLSLGLLVTAPSPPPPMQLPAAPVPAALAYAEPPPLAAGLTIDGVGTGAGRARATGTCANARRAPRFAMITTASDPYPPSWRNPAVCLAVYNPPANR
jgi:hypothetical protein